jgi:hypothetical protein
MTEKVSSLAVGVKSERSDRRKHTRFEVENEAIVGVLGAQETFRGLISDLSQSGFKLTLDRGLPAGEIIRVDVNGEVFVAVVCHSKKSKDSFTIGAEMLHTIKRVHLEELVTEWGVKQ